MHDSANSHEAILFFQDGEVQKEMMFAEFEAVLDGIVGLDDLAGEVMQAAFVMVSGRLAVKGIAFFEISFDSEGYADPKWNIPLRTLVDRSAPDGVTSACGVIERSVEVAAAVQVKR